MTRRPLRTTAALAWAAPCSLLGLLLCAPALALGARLRRVGPTLEVALSPQPARAERLARWLPFHAITFGHVVIGAGTQQLERLRTHERVHVRQYERWGLLFLAAYPLASLGAALRGACPYRDNRFEREAFAHDRDAATPQTLPGPPPGRPPG